MENIKLSAKEVLVVGAAGAFLNHDNARDEKRDNEIMFTLVEIAGAAEMAAKTTRGVIGSLVKKGLFTQKDEAYGLTDLGIDEAYRIGGDETAAETAVETEKADEAAALETAVSALKDRMSRLSKCQALRETAKTFDAGRAIFLKAAEAVGINGGTAARQWQEARGKEPAGASDEDKAALIAHLVETMAADEIATMLVEKLTKAEIKKMTAAEE